jgi:hypothetical protein
MIYRKKYGKPENQKHRKPRKPNKKTKKPTFGKKSDGSKTLKEQTSDRHI